VVSDQPIDTVVEQRPEAGRLYPKGRTVVLSVSSSEVTVPNLVGQTFEQAEAALQKLNLQAVKQEIDAPDKAPGTVIATVPKAGDKVAKGSKVTVQVAKAPPVQVPDVAGKDAATAQQILTAAGFQVVVAPTPNNSVPVNTAIGTDPVAGTKLPPGSAVTLKISSGPAATPVPNVVGQQCGAGANQLTSAGFNVAVSGTPANPASAVTSQNPSGGTAPPGSTVSITCSL
jgi:serine/threonine-protein kinase